MVQGVRSSKASQNRAGFFQPGVLLELVVYQQPNKNLQRIREFQAAYMYRSMQENVIKNTIVLFSVELLLRLLPEHAPLPALFDFACNYFVSLDQKPIDSIPNFPLFFIIQCSRYLGYDLKGNYSEGTPHLNLHEGAFTEQPPSSAPFISEDDAKALNELLKLEGYEGLKNVQMNADMRLRLLDWYVSFLQNHTQYMGNIRSLSVLRAILH